MGEGGLQPGQVVEQVLGPGGEVVPQGGGHRLAGVGVARQGGLAVRRGQLEQPGADRQQAVGLAQHRVAPPQPEGGDHLVVAAAAGVDLVAGLAEPLAQPVLDRGVAVLVGGIDAEAAGPRLLADRPQLSAQRLELAGVEHADRRQHLGPGGRRQAVPGHQREVELRVAPHGQPQDRRVERLAAIPQPAHRSSLPSFEVRLTISLCARSRSALMRMKPRASAWS